MLYGQTFESPITTSSTSTTFGSAIGQLDNVGATQWQVQGTVGSGSMSVTAGVDTNGVGGSQALFVHADQSAASSFTLDQYSIYALPAPGVGTTLGQVSVDLELSMSGSETSNSPIDLDYRQNNADDQVWKFVPTLANDQITHVHFTLDQATAPAVAFDPSVGFAFRVNHGDAGFGFDANNFVRIDNVKIQTISGTPGTFIYDTSTISNAWMNSAHWTNGPSDKAPGINSNASAIIDNNSTDIATIGTVNFDVHNGLGINMNINSSNGVGINAAANGLLSIGAINFTSTSFTLGSSSALTTLQIGNSSTAASGILQLNGATVGGMPNTIIAATGTKNLTIANVPAGTTPVTMGVRLGNTNNVVQVAAGNTVTISSNITELKSASSLNKAGAGTLNLAGVNSFSGGTSIDGGILALGSSGALGTSGTISFGSGTLQFSSSNSTDYSARFSPADNQAYNVDTNGQSVTLAGGLTSFGGSLTKLGAGTLTLSGNNSYSGETTVGQGTLLLQSGNALGNSPVVSVASGATLNASPLFNFILPAGRTLQGNGEIRADVLTLNSGSALRGNLTVNVGPVYNSGIVAPGSSPGILVINNDYVQSSTGTLEIEVGGLTPGTEHDKLVVSGTASLAGRLDLPIINGFVPALNDEITFLTAGLGVTGQFTALSAPGLASANPNVAIDVIYNNNEVRLRFVAPSNVIQFDGQSAVVDWANASTWTTNTVPDTTNIIAVQNLVSGAQRVDVATENAFVHELTIASSTGPITVGVQAGLSLSATSSVTVGNQGVIELNGGQLVSAAVTIDQGGRLAGIGTVTGNVVVGAASGASSAMLSPGTTTTPNGHFDVVGTYQQGATGTLAIDIHGAAAGQFDTIDVTGQAKLGGALMIDATGLAAPAPGTVPTFPIITAGSLSTDPNDVFSTVTTVGNPSVYFAAIYSSGSGAGAGAGALGGGASAAVGAGAAAGEYAIGDMNRDGFVNANDTDLFALALANRKAYYSSKQMNNACICVSGDISGDVNGNGRLDFGDIRKFATMVSGSGSASYTDVLARIEADLRSVPEPSSILLMAWGSLFMASCFPKWASGTCRPIASTTLVRIARR